MAYYISSTVKDTFENTVERITSSLGDNGFGIVSDINMSETLKVKIGKEIPNYRILGACNPHYAFEAVTSEAQIGVMLPCSVIVRDQGDGLIEVASIDPIASLSPVDNEKLGPFAEEVKVKLAKAIENV